MGIATASLDSSLHALDAKVAALLPRAGRHGAAIQRWQTDLCAVRFHLERDERRPMLLCILGGTGTGKSTLVNRILEANLSAASFRRTFTAGAVAMATAASLVPQNWLGLPHVVASPADLPARGQSDALVIIEARQDLLNRVVLVDTPDLDGDQPAHHAQADRAFRWAEAVIFLVSPEKYQMTELMPYYRLARRYGVAAIFVMNKCETAPMLEDYRALLAAEGQGAPLFAIPRDDAAYHPPREADLAALRKALAEITPSPERAAGMALRAVDLLGRLRDQVIGPLRAERRDIDSTAGALRALETAPPGVDVNPITEQLQRRLQQRSVLYLIGPGRVLDRIRQVPALLVRLPRNAWDLLFHGKASVAASGEVLPTSRELPDFAAVLTDQFTVIQSRIDDVLRTTACGQRWVGDAASGYNSSKIPPVDAGKIATEELAGLNDWLQQRWNATPRDTALLMKVLRHLPGGQKLTQWTEAAPYLLAIIVAAHHAFFGHIDLMILGGYSLATWITERLSNEVAARTRLANRTIAQRFEKLAHDQIRRCIAWIEAQAPPAGQIDAIESAANALEESIGVTGK
jgi:hypothetical protein